jgi:hypothetical protein
MIEDTSLQQIRRGDSGTRIGLRPTCCLIPEIVAFHYHESSIRRYFNVPVF